MCLCHNLFLSTCLVLLSLGTITLTYFTISIIIRLATKTRTRDYNRAKFALNFSFVGLYSCKLLFRTQAGFGQYCNKNKNIYNIRPIIAFYSHQMHDFSAKMHQIQFRLGLRPRPHHLLTVNPTIKA